jgi:hypothetical protein
MCSLQLWAWPGKGIYAIFGQKPRQSTDNASEPRSAVDSAGRYCSGQLVYHQWLVQVWADPSQSKSDEWRLLGEEPLPLLPDARLHSYPTERPYVMEKNWMPWVFKASATGNVLCVL